MTSEPDEPLPSAASIPLVPKPVVPKRKPRYFLGTFWIVVAIVLFFAGFHGLWWAILLGVAAVAYAIYLYRGGRFGFFFF